MRALWTARIALGVLLAGTLAACGSGGGGSDDSGSADAAPHALGREWVMGADNHAQAYAADSASCAECHAPLDAFCTQCHFDTAGSRVPADSGWEHGTYPHPFYDEMLVCNACHELERELGQGPAACHDCHDHPTGAAWMDKKSSEFHGDAAAADLASCQPCHGGDLRGGTSTVSCYSCHFTPEGSRVPVGSSWTHGRSGHKSYRSQQAVCNRCHSTNRTYGNAPGSCHNCH